MEDRAKVLLEVAADLRRAEKVRAVQMEVACEVFDAAPDGNVEAAMEFVRECKCANTHHMEKCGTALHKLIDASMPPEVKSLMKGLMAEVREHPEILDALTSGGIGMDPDTHELFVMGEDGTPTPLDESPLAGVGEQIRAAMTALVDEPEPEVSGEATIEGIDFDSVYEGKRDFDGRYEA